MNTTIGPTQSWRLIHDGINVLMMAELSGLTETAHAAFEAQTQRECVHEARRLGLTVPQDLEDVFSIEEVPKSVTMRQARLALLGAGLLDGVAAAIAALPSPQKEVAKIEWEYATEVQRSSGLVPMMGVALGLDDAALDALFIEAAAL